MGKLIDIKELFNVKIYKLYTMIEEFINNNPEYHLVSVFKDEVYYIAILQRRYDE